MNGVEWISDLRRRGVSLRADGENLRIKAKAATLTPELRAELATRKAELMALLAESQSPADLSAPASQNEFAEFAEAGPAFAELHTAKHLIADPRPDLEADHELWGLLLAFAFDACDPHDPAGLFGNLRGMRALGAALVLTGGRLRLDPGELDPAEYSALRGRYLWPHAGALTILLGQVAATQTRGVGSEPTQKRSTLPVPQSTIGEYS